MGQHSPVPWIYSCDDCRSALVDLIQICDNGFRQLVVHPRATAILRIDESLSRHHIPGIDTNRSEILSQSPAINCRYYHELNPRHKFCLHVEKASVRSVVEKAPQSPKTDIEGMHGSGPSGIEYVNVVDAGWSLEEEKERR